MCWALEKQRAARCGRGGGRERVDAGLRMAGGRLRLRARKARARVVKETQRRQARAGLSSAPEGR